MSRGMYQGNVQGSDKDTNSLRSPSSTSCQEQKVVSVFESNRI